MRGSSIRTLLPLLLAAACAAPSPALAERAMSLDSTATATPATIASAESVHVFLVTQLAVTVAEAVDSAALVHQLDRAAAIMITALTANGVRLHRVAGYVRRVEPPNSGFDSTALRHRVPSVTRSASHLVGDRHRSAFLVTSAFASASTPTALRSVPLR